MCVCTLILFVTPWTGAQQAPKSMEFSSQEYWSGLTFTTPWDLPNLGIKFTSSPLAGGFFTTVPPGKPSIYYNHEQYIHYIYRTLFIYIYFNLRSAKCRFPGTISVQEKKKKSSTCDSLNLWNMITKHTPRKLQMDYRVEYKVK